MWMANKQFIKSRYPYKSHAKDEIWLKSKLLTMTIMQIFYTINYTKQQRTWNDSPSNHSAILVGDHLQLYNLVMFSSIHHQFFFKKKNIYFKFLAS